jgi:hypothetical protein
MLMGPSRSAATSIVRTGALPGAMASPLKVFTSSGGDARWLLPGPGALRLQRCSSGRDRYASG